MRVHSSTSPETRQGPQISLRQSPPAHPERCNDDEGVRCTLHHSHGLLWDLVCDGVHLCLGELKRVQLKDMANTQAQGWSDQRAASCLEQVLNPTDKGISLIPTLRCQHLCSMHQLLVLDTRRIQWGVGMKHTVAATFTLACARPDSFHDALAVPVIQQKRTRCEFWLIPCASS